jgi:hypothetical protein
MPSRIASILAIGVSLALVTSHAQVSEGPLVFTRPTIVAALADGPQFFHDLIFEDNVYRIVGRHYGHRGKYTPGLFVHRKGDDRWLQITGLTTEHARLGRSPDMYDIALSAGWNYAYLREHQYAPVPRMGGSVLAFPDRIQSFPGQETYRMDFNSRLNREVSITWFWVKHADLRTAFTGAGPRVR